ncbi:MAG: PIN domain-containing protein, partial [Candidatus Bipolaricaulota bacterium]|nr:PIN domain-containing protein [Candidatus Bipolaricaulota bacterium]
MTEKNRGREPKGFIDTNILLRYLQNDLPEQADAVEALLKRAAAGNASLATNVMVIAELVWTCESFYKLSKQEIRDTVLMILNTPGLQVENHDLLLQATLLYADQNIDFIDAYNGCWAKNQKIPLVFTFDQRHYKRI